MQETESINPKPKIVRTAHYVHVYVTAYDAHGNSNNFPSYPQDSHQSRNAVQTTGYSISFYVDLWSHITIVTKLVLL